MHWPQALPLCLSTPEDAATSLQPRAVQTATETSGMARDLTRRRSMTLHRFPSPADPGLHGLVHRLAQSAGTCLPQRMVPQYRCTLQPCPRVRLGVHPTSASHPCGSGPMTVLPRKWRPGNPARAWPRSARKTNPSRRDSTISSQGRSLPRDSIWTGTGTCERRRGASTRLAAGS